MPSGGVFLCLMNAAVREKRLGSGSCHARSRPAQKGDSQMEILQVKQIHKIYGEKENKVHALRDVSFTVDQGEFIAITETNNFTILANIYICTNRLGSPFFLATPGISTTPAT